MGVQKEAERPVRYRPIVSFFSTAKTLTIPPLLIVCDLDRFEIHTNFTNTATVTHSFDLEGVADPENRDIFRRAFTDPESLRPGLTPEHITEQASEHVGQIAESTSHGWISCPAHAHFLMKLMFCMFAEDIELLPDKLLTRKS